MSKHRVGHLDPKARLMADLSELCYNVSQYSGPVAALHRKRLATPGEARLWYEVIILIFTHSDEGGSRAVPSSTGAFQTSRILTIAGVRAAHDTYTVFLPPLLPAFIFALALGSAADLPGLRMAFAAGAIVPLLGLPFVAPLSRGNS